MPHLCQEGIAESSGARGWGDRGAVWVPPTLGCGHGVPSSRTLLLVTASP